VRDDCQPQEDNEFRIDNLEWDSNVQVPSRRNFDC
jgi:hypothetical protein